MKSLRSFCCIRARPLAFAVLALAGALYGASNRCAVAEEQALNEPGSDRAQRAEYLLPLTPSRCRDQSTACSRKIREELPHAGPLFDVLNAEQDLQDLRERLEALLLRLEALEMDMADGNEPSQALHEALDGEVRDLMDKIISLQEFIKGTEALREALEIDLAREDGPEGDTSEQVELIEGWGVPSAIWLQIRERDRQCSEALMQCLNANKEKLEL